MRLFYRLTVISLFAGLFLMAGCSSGDDPLRTDGSPNAACLATAQPTPPTPFDDASRLVSVQAEIKRLQCECAVQAGTYACVADCEADLFKLEPNGNAQCLRDLFAANPLEAPMLDCKLAQLEGLASCLATTSCNEDASNVCLAGLEDPLNACPTGPGSLGDSFGFDLSGPVDTAFLGIPESSFPAAKAVFTDQNFYPGASILPLVNLPTFTSTDVGSLAGGTLTNVSGAPFIQYNFDLTSFTVAVDPIFTFLLNYTATGTLTDTLGGPPGGLNGARLDIKASIDSHESPVSTVTAPGFKQVEWTTDAEYTLTFPNNSVASIGGVPSRLLAYDSFFDVALDSCLDLPGNQLAALYGESLDTAFDQVCRCVADDAERDQCLQARQSPRIDCLAQVADFNPIATAVTECLVEELDDETDFMAAQACCENPGDIDCLNPDPFSGALLDTLNAGRCTPSAEAREFADVILACMGPLPPPPVDFSDDPARCTPTQPMLASGNEGEFMVVSHSQKVDLTTGNLYKRDYLVLNLDQLSVLASIPVDAAQQFLFSLYLLDNDPAALDNDPLTASKDQCEQRGIVSIALDYSGPPPQYLQIGGLLGDVEGGLDELDDLIAQASARVEAFAEELATDLICGAAEGVMGAKETNAGFAALLFEKIAGGVALAALGCI